MKILVTGANGQLGHDVVVELLKRNTPVIGCDIGEGLENPLGEFPGEGIPYLRLDVTDEAAIAEAIRETKPDAVIHCAAWTAVDAAQEEANREKVLAVNAGGTASIAKSCREIGAKMMYISTDYVFHGKGTEPWKPDCRDLAPVNLYGQSKLEGEKAVQSWLERYFILRTSWVFGLMGKNFVNSMLKASQKTNRVRVVADQIGTPTYTPDLARLIADMIVTDSFGCYHATNEGGYISWYEFACEIFRQTGQKTKVEPVTTKEYGFSKAIRPLNSRLDKGKLREKGFQPLPDWRDGLKRYLERMGEIASEEDPFDQPSAL